MKKAQCTSKSSYPRNSHSAGVIGAPPVAQNDIALIDMNVELGGNFGGRHNAVPTRRVVAGFGPISADNRRVVAQEWLAEAFTMWGVAAMVIVATAAGGAATDVRAWVYRVGRVHSPRSAASRRNGARSWAAG